MIIQRRNFLIGLASAFAAPAIVRAESLMPVKALEPDWLNIVPAHQAKVWDVDTTYNIFMFYRADGTQDMYFTPERETDRMTLPDGFVEAHLFTNTWRTPYSIRG